MTNVLLRDLRGAVDPGQGGADGLLLPLLLVLHFVTGVVDAFSYLALGHVFVGNMTGNVVFLGFALAGAKAFSATASLVALAAFWCGALVGGRLRPGARARRLRALGLAVTAEAALVCVAMVVALAGGPTIAGTGRLALIVALAVAMGVQSAAASSLAIPGQRTTVLTSTLVETATGGLLAGRMGATAGRWVAVASMLTGAFCGAALVLRVHAAAAAVLAEAVLVSVAVVSLTVPDRPA